MELASKGLFDVIPGGGIQLEHVKTFKESGFKCIHLSAITEKVVKDSENSFFNNSYEGISDINLIKDVIKLVS